ncbi:GNAT family N-acetyltransferase [Consotaella salsifontis]|uniref:Predicted acetyltransferase n=1 Tax=Consotaella salsifontis TaxID=1365950 RepID=A0A1T4S7Q2_9HYPH|nr:GNAT family N-acetyltransferase [Consotaella salsifontis]SKA24265.1 Predicted acetyltransferase [Consotaella salsifontis]
MMVRPATEADLPFIVDAYRLAFAFGEARTRRYVETTGLDCFRILETGGQRAAALAIIACGHWFGGRIVPAANIAHVAIQPEFRGTGLTGDLLELSCEEARKGGASIVSLFASTRPVYRRAGFGLAGVESVYEAETAELYKVRQEVRCRRVPLTEARAALEPIHQRACLHESGVLARHDAHWNSHLDEGRGEPHVFVFGDEEGYAIIDTSDSGRVELRDWTALNGAAARQILKFIGTFSTVYPKVRWHGAPHDALVFAMPDKGWALVHQEEFLMKILDPEAALSARGYACADAALTLAIEGERRRLLRLSIQAGRGNCTTGEEHGAADLTIAQSQLPALFSGFRSATFLRRAGLASGSDDAVAMAERIFSGPPPWVGEHF